MIPSRVAHPVLVAAIAAASGIARADDVRNITCPLDQVIIARDGVLLLPLDAERHGTDWPATITVRFGSGERIEAHVAWRYVAGRPVDVHWTTPPLGLAVRAIEPGDDSSQSPNSPILIAAVPRGASGDVRLLNKTVRAIWLDAPRDPAGTIMDQPDVAYPDDYLQLEIAPDRPDPDSPFEYWRWVLLASRYGIDAPDPMGSEIEKLLARYTADLWRMGLGRLARESRGVARDCRDLLTTICLDGNRPFAAWITDGDDLSQLLDILLDTDRSGREVVRDALAWADTRDRLFFWAERDDDQSVYLAVVNAGRDERTVEFRWEFTGEAQKTARIPAGISAPPGRLMRVRLDRPRDQAGALPRVNLAVDSETFHREVSLRPAALEAKPPGVEFGPLHPVLTLAEAQATQFRPAAPEYLTSAMLRRIDGRWEVFYECFRPDADRAQAAEPRALEEAPTVAHTRGIEAVTLFIGPEDDPATVLTVAEEGAYRIWTGAPSNALEVHRNSLSDRWFCRIVLPDDWLNHPTAKSVEVGFVRTHAGTSAFETSPDLCLPWNFSPGRMRIGLHSWTDLPLAERDDEYRR